MAIPGLINPLNRKEGIPNPNLLNQIQVEDVVRPPGFWTAFIFEGLALAAAVLTGWTYFGYLNAQVPLWQPVAASSFFLLAGIFPLLMTQNLSRRMILLALNLAGVMGFFYKEAPQFLLSVFVAAYFFLLWGETQSRSELKNSLRIKFGRVVHNYLNKTISALCLVAVLLFLPHWDAEHGFLSRVNYQGVYDSTSRFINQFYQELKLNSTFGEFAESFVKLQFTGNTSYEHLLPPAKAKALAEAKVQFLQEIQKSWGVQIAEDKPLADVTYEYLIRLFNDWRGNFGERFLAAWAIVVFFLVRSFGFVASLAISAVGYFVFQLLLAMNVIHIRGETIMQEHLEFS